MHDIKDTLQRYKRLQTNRTTWDSHWDDIADVMVPQRAAFTTTRTPGEKRLDRIFDGTPLLAVRGLAAAIDGMVKPKTSKWFSIKAADNPLNENDEVKAWLEKVEEATFDAIYERRAGFVQRSGEVDADLAAFGTGGLMITPNKQMNGLIFRSLPLYAFWIDEGEDGTIDTLFHKQMLTARQAEQRWGREALSDQVRECLEKKKPDEKAEYVHCTYPRRERDRNKRDYTNMPFASEIIDVKAEHEVQKGGYHEFPYAIPRWDTRSGEIYGWSPGMLALPDALTLNAQGKTVLRAGQKAVDPPLVVPNDGLVKTAQVFPGGVVTYDAKTAMKLGNRHPIETLDIAGNIPIGRDMMQDSRDQVWAAFFRNVLNLPVDGPQMTATEVIERKEEFIRVVGPVFSRLENEYVGPTAERVFAILRRMSEPFWVMGRDGILPIPPELLQGRGVRFEYANPVEKVRRQIETVGAVRTVEMIGPFVAAQPDIMDNFDGDEIARDAGEFNGMPGHWIRPKDDVKKMREIRQKAAQEEAAKMDAERMVEGATKVAGVMPQ